MKSTLKLSKQCIEKRVITIWENIPDIKWFSCPSIFNLADISRKGIIIDKVNLYGCIVINKNDCMVQNVLPSLSIHNHCKMLFHLISQI